MNTSASGLSATEVAELTAAGKTNDTHQQTSRSVKDILRANIFTRFNALLLILVVIVLFVGSPVDALFGLIAVVNSAIGIFQELRAKRTLDRLAILHAPVAHVVRDGELQQIPVTQVVLGDLLKLSVGDQVPADAELVSSEGLEIDESLLTGEADPIAKKIGQPVLSGSFVVAGQGFAKTTAVGTDAYAYKISAQAKQFKIARSELVEGTNKLLGYISIIIVIVGPILLWGQIARSGNDLPEALIRSVAAIEGMVPNGLVFLTSLAFMLATLALVRRKVLVQQLPAVEGLARVDVLCLDKTGTLTEGKIVFDKLQMLDKTDSKTAEQVLAAFAAEPNSPTLHALHEAFQQAPQHAYTVPFSSARKWSAIVLDGEHWLLGAPEMLLQAHQKTAAEHVQTAADSGNRVLVLLRAPSKPTAKSLPAQMQPVALVILSEKVRADARETLAFFAKQHVTIKVISGDSPRTVAAVARAVGITVGEPIDARHVPSSPAELAEVLATHTVFGRVTPDQKRAMVKALQSQGHTVAMTGDGVNDALALKDADIGIAMGSGAQATKAIAELVLLDNQFAQMPHVLAEGRRVIANIERVASLFLIKNVYNFCLALAVTVAALPFPFLPRHLSILSALTIGIPAFFLSLAPNNALYRPGFLRRVLGFSVPAGVILALLIFASYLTVTRTGGSSALASTVSSSVVAIIGAWVLLCLARPLRWWKVLIITGLTAVFAILIALPITRDILQFEFAPAQLWPVLGFGALGIACIEALWRWDQQKTAR